MSAEFATICVLSYERPEFLTACLETVSVNADYPTEVIVHDDGSRNPMVKEVIFDGLQTGRISHAIFNPEGHNEGQGTALNRMFHMAAGDPIVKCDQDLLFAPGWLKECVDILAVNNMAMDKGWQDPPIGVLGLFKYMTDPVDHRKMHIADWGGVPHGWEQVEDFVGSAMVVPRPVWEIYGPFEEHSAAFAEDRDFKFKVRDDELALALPVNDLCVNQGFGVGPSTVVVDHGIVAKIHTGPRLVTPNYVRPIVPGTGSEA